MKNSLLIVLLLGFSLSHTLQAETADHDDHGHEHHEDHESHSKYPDDHDLDGHEEHEEDDHHDHEHEHEHDEDDHIQKEDMGNHDHDDEHEHHEEQATKIEDNMANQVGIDTARAASHELQKMIVVYGSLSTGPEQLSHVRARYSGMIKKVQLTLGDQVERGSLLAKVESNDSLKVYDIQSPISGTIIQRHANTGEVTQDQVLFTIANFDTLWAEFRIYPSQLASVRSGQSVRIVLDDLELEGPIQHIIPALDKPYQLARVSFNNRNRGLTPGLLVEGHVVVDRFTADLAVEKSAIQTLGEETGVFIKQNQEYRFAPLQLGRSDDHFVEVLSGLDPGQEYVYKNSYLIKADIEKSEAEHVH